MSKRLLALILVMSLMLLTTACKKKKDIDNSSDNTSGSFSISDGGSENSESTDSAGSEISSGNTSESSSKTTSAGKTQSNVKTVGNTGLLPKIDLKNKTVKLICHYDISKSGNLAAYAEKTYGIKIDCQVVPYDQRQTRFINMSLSGQAPDLYPSAYNPTMYNSGYLQPVEDKFDWDSALWKGIKNRILANKWKGHVYTVTDQFSRYSYVYFNKSMFDEAGETYPSKLFEKGQWDWNKFYELAENLTIDAKNTGTPSQYGAGLGEGGDLLYTTGVGFVTLDKNGNPKNNIMSAGVQRFIDFYCKLSKSGFCYKGDTSPREAFAQGKIAMLVGHMWYKSGYTDYIKKGILGMAPLPKDPKADKTYTKEEGNTSWCIAAKAKNVDGAVALLNVMRLVAIDKDIIEQSYQQGIKDGTLTKQLDEEIKLNDKVQVGFADYVSVFGYSSYVGDIFNRPLNGEPWSTVAAQVKDAIDFYIDEVVNSTPD